MPALHLRCEFAHENSVVKYHALFRQISQLTAFIFGLRLSTELIEGLVRITQMPLNDLKLIPFHKSALTWLELSLCGFILEDFDCLAMQISAASEARGSTEERDSGRAVCRNSQLTDRPLRRSASLFSYRRNDSPA